MARTVRTVRQRAKRVSDLPKKVLERLCKFAIVPGGRAILKAMKNVTVKPDGDTPMASQGPLRGMVKAMIQNKQVKDRIRNLSAREQTRTAAVNSHWIRLEMRRKLFTGRSRVVRGRGGLVLSANYLASTWQLFLDCQAEVEKPFLSMADILLMVERGETPGCRAFGPRPLARAELLEICDWCGVDVDQRGALHHTCNACWSGSCDGMSCDPQMWGDVSV